METCVGSAHANLCGRESVPDARTRIRVQQVARRFAKTHVGSTHGNSQEYNVGGAHGKSCGQCARKSVQECRNTRRCAQKPAQVLHMKRCTWKLVWAVRAGAWEAVHKRVKSSMLFGVYAGGVFKRERESNLLLVDINPHK